MQYKCQFGFEYRGFHVYKNRLNNRWVAMPLIESRLDTKMTSLSIDTLRLMVDAATEQSLTTSR
jgi:hypothetical protein